MRAEARKRPVTAGQLPSIGELLDREGLLGYVLLVPAILILAAFIGYPFLSSLWLAVTDRSVSATAVTFVGLDNFKDELRSQIFLQTARNSFVYTAVTVAFKLVFGVALAVLMDQSFRLKNFARAALLLPWIVPTALSTIAWLWLFDATFSVFNWAIVRSGLADRGINWLGEGGWAMTAIIIANIWRGTPFFAITILAGLQTVERELLDAAAVDGAGAWQRFWRITLPLVRPVLLIVLLFSVIWTISDFQLVYVLTRGGPTNSTHLFGTLAYDAAVRAGQLSQGAAISLYMFPVLILCVAALLLYLRRSSS